MNNENKKGVLKLSNLTKKNIKLISEKNEFKDFNEEVYEKDYICKDFGNSINCTISSFCPHKDICAESVQDTEENYCSQCGYLLYECICNNE